MNVCRTLAMALVLCMAGPGAASAESRVSLGYLYQRLDSEEAGSDREADLHGLELRIYEQQQNGWFGEFLARGAVGDGDFVGAGSDEETWAVEYRLGRRLTEYVGLYSGVGYREWQSDQDNPDLEITVILITLARPAGTLALGVPAPYHAVLAIEPPTSLLAAGQDIDTNRASHCRPTGAVGMSMPRITAAWRASMPTPSV